MELLERDRSHDKGRIFGDIQRYLDIGFARLHNGGLAVFEPDTIAAVVLGIEAVAHGDFELACLAAEIVILEPSEQTGRIDNTIHDTHSLAAALVADHRNEMIGVVAGIVREEMEVVILCIIIDITDLVGLRVQERKDSHQRITIFIDEFSDFDIVEDKAVLVTLLEAEDYISLHFAAGSIGEYPQRLRLESHDVDFVSFHHAVDGFRAAVVTFHQRRQLFSIVR